MRGLCPADNQAWCPPDKQKATAWCGSDKNLTPGSSARAPSSDTIKAGKLQLPGLIVLIPGSGVTTQTGQECAYDADNDIKQ